MSARFPMEQFVSPAEVRRAKRAEERGLWSAEQYLQDLVMGRIIRLLADQQLPMTPDESAAVRSWS